jgi:hypothetical protein
LPPTNPEQPIAIDGRTRWSTELVIAIVAPILLFVAGGAVVQSKVGDHATEIAEVRAELKDLRVTTEARFQADERDAQDRRVEIEGLARDVKYVRENTDRILQKIDKGGR